MVLTLSALVAVASAAAVVWALRPTPTFSSDDVATGSPFDVTFRIENRDAWFPLSNLKVGCVLAFVRASPIEPTLVDATDVRLSGKEPNGLEPGEAGTFKCPFRAVLGQPSDDAGTAQRAEIYFRSVYDVPLIGTLRLTDNSAPFILNTRLLPPRWTRKSGG